MVVPVSTVVAVAVQRLVDMVFMAGVLVWVSWSKRSAVSVQADTWGTVYPAPTKARSSKVVAMAGKPPRAALIVFFVQVVPSATARYWTARLLTVVAVMVWTV